MLCANKEKYGTQHMLYNLIDSQICALDNNKCVGKVLMDLSKL